ncbi:MAG TPA: hypothetical protein DEP51_07135 [Clostridiales bacterium]|nr:hypothetical protein [Clostridiales bacterium]
MLSGDNGILQKAADAKTNTEKANEKEQIQLEVLGSYNKSGELEISTVNSNIKNNITGVTTDDATKFPLTVTYISSGNSYTVDEDATVEKAIIYPPISELLNVNLSAPTEVEKSPYVQYVDSFGNNILCRVLYNNSGTVEIVALDCVGRVLLGYMDPKIPNSENGYDFSKTIEKARWSYNNAIKTLNDEASKYNNSTLSDRARCIGSNYQNPYKESSMSGWNRKLKGEDSNSSQDEQRLNALNEYNLKNNEIYWLSSRTGYAGADEYFHYIRCVGEGVDLSPQSDFVSFDDLCIVEYGDSLNYNYQNPMFKLRPVFRLLPDIKIKSGDGSYDNPYILKP